MPIRRSKFRTILLLIALVLPLTQSDPIGPPPSADCPPGPSPAFFNQEQAPPATLPEETSGESGASPEPLEPLLDHHPRAGFGLSTTAEPAYWADLLGASWYVSWRVAMQPSTRVPQHWQMIRLSGSCIKPSRGRIAWIAKHFPGHVWIIGNEPDVYWQDYSTPEYYAERYHELYALIKANDPSALVAVGAVAQASPLRLAYLDRVLDHYQTSYGESLPADWWTIHGFVLREEWGAWGVQIPPEGDPELGQLYSFEDHGNLTIFENQLRAFRVWMARHGYQDTPLALTEFGILLNSTQGYDRERIASYLIDSFQLLESLTDNEVGYPMDNYHLVQRWAWFSLSDPIFPYSDLANLDSGKLTSIGLAFRNFVQEVPPTP